MAFFKNLLGKQKAPAAGGPKKETKSAKSQRETAAADTKPDTPANIHAGIGVLMAPHITEKTADGGRLGTYTFRVHSGSSKILVRDAVEKRYGVKVESIRITKAKPKIRRFGRRFGTVPGYTKAVVRLAAGQTIEVGA